MTVAWMTAMTLALTMAMADASGLGRTTVYRHFAAREDLLEAVFVELLARQRPVIAAVVAEQSGTERTILALSVALLDINSQFGPLLSLREIGDQAFRASQDVEASPTGTFINAARERGEIRTDMPLYWQLSLMQTLSLEALDEVNDGRLDRAEAERLVAESLASILIPR